MEIGEAVLHPRYGVGVIESIEERSEYGVDRNYYVIPKPSMASTILVPVDTADQLGLRPLATAETLKQAISILSGEADDADLCDEEAAINWSDPIGLARAIRGGMIGPKSRYPKITQQQQLKRAKRLLTEELSAVLGMSEESSIALIDKKPK
ncbi:MAG: CarD family transcriptional regulator [Armatimonadota bacterium]